jgi:hypothetical protein
MPLYIKVAGAWKEFEPSVKVAGVWKAITDGYVNVSGVWKRIYESAGPFLETFNFSSSGLGSGPGSTSALMTFNTNGTLVVTGDGSIGSFGAPNSAEQWYNPTTVGIGPSFDVRITPTTGTFSGGAAVSVWHTINTARSFSVIGDNKSVTFTIEIRATGGAVRATSTGNVIAVDYSDIGGG